MFVIFVYEIYGVNSYMKKMVKLIKMVGYDVIIFNLFGDGEVYLL